MLSEEQVFKLRESNFIEVDGEYGKTFFLPGIRGCGISESGRFFYRDNNDKKVFLDADNVRSWGDDMIHAITLMMNVLDPKRERTAPVQATERISAVRANPCASIIAGRLRLNMAAVKLLPGSESSYFVFTQDSRNVYIKPSSFSSKEAKKFVREYGADHGSYALTFSSKAFLLDYFADAASEKTVQKNVSLAKDGKTLIIEK